MSKRLTANPSPRGRSGDLDLSVTATTGPELVPWVRRMLLRAHALLRSPLRELSVALVGDQRMSRLHMRFLGLDHPTDVLSFELEHDGRGRVMTGEVVVCVPEARRQARRRPGGSVRNEVLLYSLHGMLHLTGYDDTTDDGYRKMHAKEDDILRRLGVGPVFDNQLADPAGRRKDCGVG